MSEKIIITLTSDEATVVLSALSCDRIGTWGDGRQEKLDKISDKIKRARRIKKITGFTN